MNLSLEYKQALPINSSQLTAWRPAGPGTLSMHVAYVNVNALDCNLIDF